MRFEDNPEMPEMSANEVLDQLFSLAQDLKATTKHDGGPAKLKLESGAVITGEVAEMWQRFQEGVIRVLETAVYRLEREIDAK